jgi:hypothetical protein
VSMGIGKPHPLSEPLSSRVRSLADDAGGAAAQQSRQAPGAALSERGVLQLLFDAQLLRTALAGGRPPSSGRSAAQPIR